MNTQNNHPSSEQIEKLITSLGDPNVHTRQHARMMLTHFEDRSVPQLVEALKSPRTQIRKEAVQALGQIRDRHTARVLTSMLLDDDTGVRWAAMESLIHLGRASLKPLLELLVKHFDSYQVREGARHILRTLKTRDQLTDIEIQLFKALDHRTFTGFEEGWTSNQAWAAERALEALNQETDQTS